MSTPHETLARELRVQFKLPYDRPSEAELTDILSEVEQLVVSTGRAATTDEWRNITLRRVRFDGEYIYKGLTFQDLNALLAAIRAQAAQGRSK